MPFFKKNKKKHPLPTSRIDQIILQGKLTRIVNSRRRKNNIPEISSKQVWDVFLQVIYLSESQSSEIKSVEAVSVDYLAKNDGPYLSDEDLRRFRCGDNYEEIGNGVFDYIKGKKIPKLKDVNEEPVDYLKLIIAMPIDRDFKRKTMLRALNKLHATMPESKQWGPPVLNKIGFYKDVYRKLDC